MTPRRARGVLRGAWRHTTRSHPHVFHAAAATGRAPHVRMDVDLLRRQQMLLVALLPCAAAGVVTTGFAAVSAAAEGSALGGWRGELLRALGVDAGTGSAVGIAAHGLVIMLPLLAAAGAAAYACTWGFARARGRPLIPGTAAAVLVFTLLLPAHVAPWQAAVAMAFGVVLGREVFGGAGRTFVHPAVVGLVFLHVAYPTDPGGLLLVATGGIDALHDAGITWWDTFVGLDAGGVGDTSALACLLGAAFLLHRRSASWRVMSGALAGAVVVSALLAGGPSFPGVPWSWHLTLGSLAFVAVFVATDPASSAFTNPGRWLHGALVGSLTVVIRVASPVHVEGALFAALLGSVFVPLFDEAVVRHHVARRKRRG